MARGLLWCALVAVGASQCGRASVDATLSAADALRVRNEKAASERALVEYGDALARARERDAQLGARAAQGLGATYLQLGRLTESRAAYAEGLTLAARSSNRLLESAIRSDLGYVSAWASDQASGLDEAEHHCRTAFDLARGLGGAREEAKALECLGEVTYFKGADLEEALRIQEQAEALWRRLGDQVGAAQARYAQGYLYSDLRRFALARAAFDEARSRWEEIGDERGLALTLVAEARLLERRGEYQESLAGYRRALALFERMGDAIWQGSCLAGLAQIHLYLADSPTALDYFRRALVIAQTSGLKFFEWDMLNNVGTTLLASGDEAAAASEFSKAYALGRELENPRQQAWALTYLGQAHLALGNAESARESFERALGLVTDLAEPWLVAQALTGLGGAAASAGQPEAALAHYTRAVEASQTGGDRLHAAGGRVALGNLAARQGRLASARTSLMAALAAYRELFSAEHPLVAEANAALAQVDFWAGRTADAVGAALNAEATTVEHLRTTVRYLPERQALAFAANRPRGLDLAISAAVSAAPHAVPQVYDLVIQSRSVILDELAARQQSVSPSEPALAAPHARALRARQRYANLLVRSLEGSVPQAEFERARQDKEEAERALAASSAEARWDRPSASIGLAEVRAALPPGSALVSYVQYAANRRPPPESAPPAPVTSIAAFVVREGRSGIAVVPLGPAKAIEGAIAEWRKEAAGATLLAASSPERAEQATRLAGARLRRVIWDPLTPHVRGATRVLVAPEGSLSLVPLAALPADAGGYVLETSSPIHYLTAERDLAITSARSPAAGLLALGGPNFDVGPGAGSSGAPTDVTAALRGTGTCGSLQSVRFQPLDGTLQEIQEVARLWPSPLGVARTLVGRAAGERAVKDEASRHRVLHLATHGFFLDGACRPESADAGTRGVGGLAATGPVDNPLRLSGLALAGANLRSQARPDEDDGILTAEEVAMLDLSGTEWAVLSACDTGVGEIKAGEGVFGLRRAFQVAGARTVIMSLWSVDDQATRAWMRALYEGRFQRKLSTADAVHQASLTVLRDRRARGLSTHPFFWAAFVAAGDWR